MADGSKKPRRILHTSDLHLEKLGDKACHSLEMVVKVATKTEVDLVIIAGDLFDHNRVDDSLIDFTVAQLKQLPVDVVILPGNHDCLIPGAVFSRTDIWQDCTNVHIFLEPSGETLELPDLGMSLWGKPMDTYDHNVLPMVGMPYPQGNGKWHVAVAHGYYVRTEPPPFPSYHITKEEIVNSGWDYIALGHVVTFQCVCDQPVTAYYSGSPSLNDTVAIVDLAEETGVRVTPYSL